MLTRKRVVLAKIEDTYGVDPTPVVGTDAVLCRDISPTPLEANFVSRNLAGRSYLGNLGQLATTSMARIDLEVELSGLSTLNPAAAPVGLDALLQACGFDAGAYAVGPPAKREYKPISETFKSVTVYFNQDGVLHKMTGCRGSVSITLQAQQIPTMRFSMVGQYNALTDTAAGTPVLTAWNSPKVVDRVNTTGLSLHGFATGKLQELSIDMAVQTTYATRPGYTADQIPIVDRQPKGSIILECDTVAAKDWFTTIKAGTLGALAVQHGTGATAVKLSAPKVQLTDPSYSDSEGVAMLSMGLVLQPNAGDDELVIQFGA